MSTLVILGETTSDSGGGGFASIIFFALIFVAMYFLLLRPQRRRMKEAQLLQKSIEVGDEVLLTSGIIGFIDAIDGDVLWISIADDVTIRCTRGSIARKIDPAVEPAGGNPAATESDDQD
jgi:preprotein translocase subunit YajC